MFSGSHPLRRSVVLIAGLAGAAAGALYAQPADPAIAFVAQYSVTTGKGPNQATTTWNNRTVMNADGGAPAVVWSRTLDLATNAFLDVAWSPDLDGNPANGYQGALAAVARDDGPVWNHNLYLLDITAPGGVPQASNIRRIVDNAIDPNVASTVHSQDWSPDLDALTPGYQGRIAFQGSTDGGQTSCVNVIDMAWNGVSVEPVYGPNSSLVLWDPRLGAGTRYPTWSPDGERIAISVSRDLWVLDSRTGAVVAVVTGFPFGDTGLIQLDWSRTGSRVAFAVAGTIYTVDVDAGIGSLRAIPGASGANNWPAWSPDDSAIVFSGKDSGRRASPYWSIRKVVLATGAQTVLASSPSQHLIVPDWRPY